MVKLFFAEAARYNVLAARRPQDGAAERRQPPQPDRGPHDVHLSQPAPPARRVPPRTSSTRTTRSPPRSTIPEDGAEGMLFTQGGRFAGLRPLRAGRQAGLPLQPRRRRAVHDRPRQDRIPTGEVTLKAVYKTRRRQTVRRGDGHALRQRQADRRGPRREEHPQPRHARRDAGHRLRHRHARRRRLRDAVHVHRQAERRDDRPRLNSANDIVKPMGVTGSFGRSVLQHICAWHWMSYVISTRTRRTGDNGDTEIH